MGWLLPLLLLLATNGCVMFCVGTQNIPVCFNGHSVGEDPIVAAVEERISEWTHIPVSHGEPLEVSVLRHFTTLHYCTALHCTALHTA